MLMIDSKGKITDGTLEWSKLGLLTDLVDAVVGDVNDRLGLGLIDGPTPVQRMAIPVQGPDGICGGSKE